MPTSEVAPLRSLFTVATALALLTSCNSKTDVPERANSVEEPPVIYATTYPMKYFAERIGRGKVRVLCPVPADPEAFLQTISPEIIRAYQGADLIVTNGAGYEKWIEVACLPESRIVRSAQPLAKDLVRLEPVTHSHGQGGLHTHEGIDGHTWLDPVYARIQAEEIRKAMTMRFPEHAAELEKGFSSLSEDLAEIDRLFAAAAEHCNGQRILASHPSYNYVARRYGWDIVNLKFYLDPMEMPSDSSFAELSRALAARPSRIILWERRPRTEIAERMEAELGLCSVEFSSCSELREEDARDGLDYLGVMRRNAANVDRAFAAARTGN